MNACSVSGADLSWLVPHVSHISLLVISCHTVHPLSLNLVVGTMMQIFQGLVADLIHSEGTITCVVAWSLWPFVVTRSIVAASWRRPTS